MVVVDVSDDEKVDHATGGPERLETLLDLADGLGLSGVDQDVVLRRVAVTIGDQDRITIACGEKFNS